MTDTDLRLHAGDMVQLQATTGGTRYHVKVIGYAPGQSVIVSMPRAGGNIVYLREGQVFVVRMLSGNRVVGFTSSILRTCTHPYPYLHLSYPNQVEQTVVRKAERVQVELRGRAENTSPQWEGEPQDVVLADLSTSGALLVADTSLGIQGDVLSIHVRMTVGTVERELKIPAVIRNVKQATEGGMEHCHHGVEFQLVDQHDLLTLHGFVYERLVQVLDR